MPNWCNNTITIEGDADKIRALWDAAQAADSGLLNAMVPMPDGLRGTIKGTGDDAQVTEHDGFTNWYDWSVARWGTKWEVNMEGLEFEDLGNGRAQITGYADSAWGPPVDAFQTYANANPDVQMELKYFEPGMAFIGVWDTEGGDAYWENVGGLLEVTEEEDPVIYELLEHFDVWSWYDTDEDEEESEQDSTVTAE
jgi:hypothetical protein